LKHIERKKNTNSLSNIIGFNPLDLERPHHTIRVQNHWEQSKSDYQTMYDN